jgi:hypothetical protein
MIVPRGFLSGLAVLASLWCGAVAQAADPSLPRISFRMDRPGLQVPRYTVTVLDSGGAVYEGEEVSETTAKTVSDAPTQVPAAPRPFKEEVKLSPATTKRIFSAAKALKGFNVQCDSHMKNIADTGKKTLSFKGPDSNGECTYNYSENKSVMLLTDTFLGIAETMDEGRRLDHLHRYDRLGLDAAMTTLAEQVTGGRALELGTIAETLRSIAGDTNVMQRVRLKASQLLSLLPPEMQQRTP